MSNIALSIALVILTCGTALGQAHYHVLWSFGTPGDGSAPVGTMVLDAAGNLYGVTETGGTAGCGIVFELSPSGGAWTETVIHSFAGGNEGCTPLAGLVSDAGGNLYGTTEQGGSAPCSLPNGLGCGVVFELSQTSGEWTESILHAFGGNPDGAVPLGRLIFDSVGNLYGTTASGGTYFDREERYGGGTVFQVVPGLNGWTENILYSFDPESTTGNDLETGVTFDQTGNLYGTALRSGPDGNGLGLVYQLSPAPVPPWTETVLRKFDNKDGNGPSSDLQFDDAGHLFGATGGGGLGFGGLFRLTPKAGMWAEKGFAFNGSGGHDPQGDFLLSGNAAYGTTQEGGSPSCNDGGNLGCGVVFRTNGKTESAIHKFCETGSPPSCPDGAYPGRTGLVTDGSRNLYGTTQQGGAYNQGVVFEITP